MQPSGVIIVLVLLVLSVTTTISVVLITDKTAVGCQNVLTCFLVFWLVFRESSLTCYTLYVEKMKLFYYLLNSVQVQFRHPILIGNQRIARLGPYDALGEWMYY